MPWFHRSIQGFPALLVASKLPPCAGRNAFPRSGDGLRQGRCVVALAIAGVLAGAGAAADRADRYLAKSDDWFRSPEGQQVVANVISFQSPLGSWPKNIDDTSAAFAGDPATLKGTFDNSATTSELRLLARAYGVTPDPRTHRRLSFQVLTMFWERSITTEVGRSAVRPATVTRATLRLTTIRWCG